MKLPVPIGFEWDVGNRDKNLAKHGVHFKEIEEVFFNRPIRIFADIKHSQEEKRYFVLGKTNSNIFLAIIFTIRENKIRVISARAQNRKERKYYGA